MDFRLLFGKAPFLHAVKEWCLLAAAGICQILFRPVIQAHARAAACHAGLNQVDALPEQRPCEAIYPQNGDALLRADYPPVQRL